MVHERKSQRTFGKLIMFPSRPQMQERSESGHESGHDMPPSSYSNSSSNLFPDGFLPENLDQVAARLGTVAAQAEMAVREAALLETQPWAGRRSKREGLALAELHNSLGEMMEWAARLQRSGLRPNESALAAAIGERSRDMLIIMDRTFAMEIPPVCPPAAG